NNTFLNIGHTVVQSEARPIEYIRFVHNTLVNIGRTINSGGIWKEAYFANNLGVNVGWHGEDEADFSATRETAHNGIFGVGELPPQFGTDLEREVVFVNNAFWRDPAFESWYDANGYISQPLFTSELREGFEETIRTTQDFFDELPNMLAESNQWQVNPGLVSYTQAPAVDQFPETSIPLEDLVPDMIQTMETLRAGSTTPNWEDAWLWDPGREPGFYQAVGFVYPLPEDLSYTNETLRTAGTNGLPLGDLNWFPEAKEQWEANREQYIADIHEMVESEEVEIVAEFEAEDGVVEGDATVETVEGDTWLTIRPGGYMEWTFEIDESKEYWLDAHVHHAGRETSGIDKILNGEAIFDERGWGQFVYEPALQGVPADEWTTVRWTQDDLNENSAGAFTLPEGENTLRIQQSWADDTMWKGFDWIDPATEEVVVSLRAPQATYDAFLPGCGEDVEFCSSAFQHVAVGTGGSVSFNVDLPVTGEYLVRLFTNGAGTASVLVDDSEAVPYVLLDETTGMVLSERFQADAGVRKITVSSDAGGWDFDWGQVLVIGGTVSNERGKELPDGFALGQNYPNPFNPSTTIQYQLGKAGAAKVAVYDVLGRHVRTLVDGEMPAGQHVVTWDGRAADGSMVASGVYFYRLEAGGAFKARSMVMLK
ncbi:MAG: FlgD immunoglobulin-like domain containing protein, partial [Bacteroidota bacterium]